MILASGDIAMTGPDMRRVPGLIHGCIWGRIVAMILFARFPQWARMSPWDFPEGGTTHVAR